MGRCVTSCPPILPAATSGWPSAFMRPTVSTNPSVTTLEVPSPSCAVPSAAAAAEAAVSAAAAAAANDENAASTTASRRLFRGTRNAERASYEEVDKGTHPMAPAAAKGAGEKVSQLRNVNTRR